MKFQIHVPCSVTTVTQEQLAYIRIQQSSLLAYGVISGDTTKTQTEIFCSSQAWRCLPVILALGTTRQEHGGYEAIWGYLGRSKPPWLYSEAVNNNKIQMECS